MFPVDSTASTSTGRAPAAVMAAAVAMNVFAVVMTSSPAPIFRPRSTSSSARVPDDTPTACVTPQ